MSNRIRYGTSLVTITSVSDDIGCALKIVDSVLSTSTTCANRAGEKHEGSLVKDLRRRFDGTPVFDKIGGSSSATKSKWRPAAGGFLSASVVGLKEGVGSEETLWLALENVSPAAISGSWLVGLLGIELTVRVLFVRLL